jgi:RNA polymerase sigma factor (sigma-70 family)
MSQSDHAQDRIGHLLRSAPDDDLARNLHADAEGIVRSVLGARDPHLIQTAVNDALLAVVRYRRGFRGDCRASTWLYVVARREALRVIAREARRARNELSIDGAQLNRLTADATSDAHPGSALDARDLLDELVPNPAWRYIWLLYNDPRLRLSHAEIAARTGRTPGTIAVTLSRVRALIDGAQVEGVA